MDTPSSSPVRHHCFVAIHPKIPLLPSTPANRSIRQNVLQHKQSHYKWQQ